MNNRRSALAIVFVLTALYTLPPSAGAVLLPLASDAHTVSSLATRNRGTATSLELAGPPISTTTKNVYLQFGLATIPSGIGADDVAKATLTVFPNTVTGTLPGAFDVVLVTSPWAESLVTYASPPSLGAVEQSALPLIPTDKNEFITIDVTNAVKAWLNGSLPNNGLALVPTVGVGVNVKFDSKENTSKSQPPQLEVTLVGGLVTSTNIVDGTITSADVADGGLRNVDIDFGTGPSSYNTAVGSGALQSNTTGSLNSAVGFNALYANTTGAGNSALGEEALENNTTGSENTAVGALALLVNTTGSFNCAVGTNSLYANTTGRNNSAVGRWALFQNTTGNSNTAVGASALAHNTTADNNTAVGRETLATNATGTGNTAAGAEALTANTSGTDNCAFGFRTLSSNTSGSVNTALGLVALYANTTGDYNTAVGGETLDHNTTGSNNTAVGVDALQWNGTASDNTAVGSNTLVFNAVGGQNTAVGARSLKNNSASYNTAIGADALGANTTGSENIAIGDDTSFASTTGNHNVAVGNAALAFNTTGSYNTAVGRRAMYNTTGDANTCVGRSCLDSLTTGTSNIALGESAGGQVTTTSNNIHIGHFGVTGDAGVIRVGRAGVHTGGTFIEGISGATSAGGSTVFVNSSGRLGTSTSSRRYKTDIRDLGDASARMMQLHPVAFRYKPEIDPEGHTEYGLIAEDVAQVMPELIVYDAEGRPNVVRYHLLVPMLLNEVQKQAEQINTLRAQQLVLSEVLRENSEVTSENAALRDRLGKIEHVVEQLMAEAATRPANLASNERIAP